MSPHTGFIIAAYGVTAVVTAATILAVVLDYRSQQRAVARLSSRLGAEAAKKELP